VSDLRDLYQAVIFDHNRSPRNYGELASANRRAEGFNPLCGDHVVVLLQMSDDGVVEDVRFEGRGCAISTASASIMTETVKGLTVKQADQYFDAFHRLALGEDPGDDLELAKLEALSGVREYPSRVKCATLAWHTVRSALHDTGDTATTE
jgi:nitrogen fixation NifU-like protein|tara:strand:- start:50 stop:499 length:450 start_codon:yes stop_codon:yes gene_type:complete